MSGKIIAKIRRREAARAVRQMQELERRAQLEKWEQAAKHGGYFLWEPPTKPAVCRHCGFPIE